MFSSLKRWGKRVLCAAGYFIFNFYLALGGLWLAVETWSHFLPNYGIKGPKSLITLLTISGVIAFFRTHRPRVKLFKLPNSDTKIKLYFGDIFDATGVKAIPVNEYFDTALGQHVSKQSLHGQFIEKFFKDNEEQLYQEITENLNSSRQRAVNRPEPARGTKYPLGTASTIKIRDNQYLLFALSKTDKTSLKASVELPEFLTALNGLWSQARICCGGESLTIPLIGGGLSGLGLPPQKLIELLLLSAVRQSAKKQITKNINIVVPNYLKHDVDFRQLNTNWS